MIIIIVSMITLIVNIVLNILILLASVLYLKRCKQPHAYMFVIGCFIGLIAPVFHLGYQHVILPSMGECSDLQATIPTVIISSFGSMGYLLFSVGIFLIIKRMNPRTQGAEGSSGSEESND